MNWVAVPLNSVSTASPPGTGLNLSGDRSSTLEMPLPTPRLLYTATALTAGSERCRVDGPRGQPLLDFSSE